MGSGSDISRLDVDAVCKDAKALLQRGDLTGALAKLDDALGHWPDEPECLYLKAVCHRYLGADDAALGTLTRLKQARPDFGRAFQEEGHILKERGDRVGALRAYGRATKANPALAASWRALADLSKENGDGPEAQQAEAQAARLAALPRELVSVTSFLHEGRLLKAEKLCREFLSRHPHHVEAMRLLADLASRLNVLDDAELLLEGALALEPENVQLRIDYMRLLRKRQNFSAALAQAKLLLEKDPENPVFQSNFGVESQMAGDVDTALAMFDSVLEKLPGDPLTLMSRGHAYKTIGQEEDAVSAYRAAYHSKPDHGDAFWSLANLKTYHFTDDELDRMRAQEEDPSIPVTERIHFCFALGKAYEDREDYPTSFAYYERGNRLKRDQSRYNADHMDEELQAQIAVCTEALFEAHRGHGHPAPDPIFIVGLPRAGSTLIEQILASHSQVDGTMELPNILALSHRLRNRQRITETSPYPRNLFDLTGPECHNLGTAYIDDTRMHRAGAPFFTDKMPNNFRHIALIHLILPNARIIDARRDPMACCFGGFKQLFAEGQEFTYGLEEIGRYYRGYQALMAHWDRVLPGRILRVQYEDVVGDLDGQVRRLLDFCGLPFEQSCVDFHATKRSVRTASAQQVRQRLYRSGLDQWRHYEPFLGPLRDALAKPDRHQDPTGRNSG